MAIEFLIIYSMYPVTYLYLHLALFYENLEGKWFQMKAMMFPLPSVLPTSLTFPAPNLSPLPVFPDTISENGATISIIAQANGRKR